ncbi:unnamed protein product, partial [Polarella glacialis]
MRNRSVRRQQAMRKYPPFSVLLPFRVRQVECIDIYDSGRWYIHNQHIHDIKHSNYHNNLNNYSVIDVNNHQRVHNVKYLHSYKQGAGMSAEQQAAAAGAAAASAGAAAGMSAEQQAAAAGTAAATAAAAAGKTSEQQIVAAAAAAGSAAAKAAV